MSKRDVSAGAKAIRGCGLTFDAVRSMDADVIGIVSRKLV